MRATWLAHIILLHVIALTIFSNEHKLWSASLCNITKPPFTSYSSFGPNVVLNNLFSNNINQLYIYSLVNNNFKFVINHSSSPNCISKYCQKFYDIIVPDQNNSLVQIPFKL
jgi:hypothetical protein